MEKMAVEQAKVRLARAKSAVVRMADVKNAREIQAAWLDFLIAADAVYSKLGAGARSRPASRTWYGDKMALRKSDELLNYVHQAKNADSHGLEDGMRPSAPNLEALDLTKPRPDLKPGQKILNIRATDGSIGARLLMTIPRTLVLTPVTNRGVTFPPPRAHLGTPLKSGPITAVAQMVCDHLAQLIDEAGDLPTD